MTTTTIGDTAPQNDPEAGCVSRARLDVRPHLSLAVLAGVAALLADRA